MGDLVRPVAVRGAMFAAGVGGGLTPRIVTFAGALFGLAGFVSVSAQRAVERIERIPDRVGVEVTSGHWGSVPTVSSW